mmetsp:Transcript_24955/g.70270  ORF Transcript_24955/g.70270 Transcript_24955/m.70270 type:complete len:808 (+) Transcript_24955:83-2506(+)
MTFEHDAEQLKKTFKKVDKKGDGTISRADLIAVFQELEDWSKEDLNDLFDAVDKNEDGFVKYHDFIDWVMADDDEAPDPDFESDEDSDDDGDSDALEDEIELANADLDLGQLVTSDEWVKVMDKLGEDEDEAIAMYGRSVEEAQQDGHDTKEGVPLVEFMDELQIEPEDREELVFLVKTVEDVKKHAQEPAVKKSTCMTLATALDRVVHELDTSKRPAEDALKAMDEGEVLLSQAGEAALRKLSEAELIDRVKDCMVNPPLLPANAGTAGNRERCTAAVNAIIAKCRADGTKFTDTKWDLNKTPELCLYVDKMAEGYDCTVAKPAAFKRMTELTKDPMLFKGGIHAGDIVQGQIGTCFLLGAMGAIAGNKEDGIRRVFIKYDTEVGVYGVRFCLDGEWTYVIVDDLMPVDANGRLLYARSNDPQEVWCPILEKAYCKLHNCYEMCDGGRPNEAIFSLFGGVSGKLLIKPKHKEDPMHYFHALEHARQHGWLLTTSFVVTKAAKKGSGKCGEAVLPTGLVGGHVYSVLKCATALGNHLVCCRNPWGTGEWTGKWSDKNAFGEWTDEMKQAVSYSGLNDGKFWMSIEDFVNTSGGVEYARTFGPKWKKITQYKHFQKGSMRATALWAYKNRADDEVGFDKGATIEVGTVAKGWWHGNVLGSDKKGYFPGNYVKLNDRPVARFDLVGTPDEGLEGPMTAVVMLMQPNSKMARKYIKRKQDGKNYKDISYSRIQLVVIGPDGKVALKVENRKRCVSSELKLTGGGQWKIYALSLDGRGSDFSVRVYVKDGSAQLTEVSGSTLSEIETALAQ